MSENRRPLGFAMDIGNGYSTPSSTNHYNHTNANTNATTTTDGTAAATKTKKRATPLKHVDFAAMRKARVSPMAVRRGNGNANPNVIVQEDGDEEIDEDVGGGGRGGLGHGEECEEGEGDARRSKERESDHLAVLVDTQRMQLISPPPEEMLRRGGNARHSGQFTPSLLADRQSSPGAASTGTGTSTKASKRKRAQPASVQGSAFMSTGVSTAAGNENDNDGSMGHVEPQQAVEATPNPKPRKQGRHVRMPSAGSPTTGAFSAYAKDTTATTTITTPTKSKRVVIKSPHVRNPDADWIPPVAALAPDGVSLANPSVRRAVLGARSSRRSATPIPPYEPPTDVFTPPREVYMSPPAPKSVSKSSKRKTKKGKGLRVVTAPVQVKQELPDDIDLEAPMPPPSPTDDPLLLSGPPEPEPEPMSTPVRMRRRSVSVQVQTQEEEEVDVLPPSSPEPLLDSEDREAVTAFNWEQHVDGDASTDSMMQLDDPRDVDVSPVRLFDVEVGDGGAGWSDSDDEEEEGEGEYTGRWRTLLVRTKLDPPSSATRGRMEQWGRPISPFPRLALLAEEQDDMANAEEEQEVRQMSVEFEEPTSPFPAEESVEQDDVANSEEEQQVRQMSVAEPVRQPSPAPPTVVLDGRRSSNIFAFESPQAGPSAYSLKDVSCATPFVDDDTQMQEDDNEQDSSDSDDEPGLVKITSADPRAAARAVAILKQHDYDCYTKLVKRRRASHSGVDDLAKESRRRDVSGAGVSKSTHKNRRRSTLGMGVIGDRVFIPGTPVMTLPELLQEAEKQVVRESPGPQVWTARRLLQGSGERDPFKTPLPERFRDRPERRMSALRTEIQKGEPDWTKEEWKLLDACFTDQRLEVGANDGSLAPVDAVAIEDVLRRFIDMMGGQSVVDTLGEAWSRDNILERTRALQRKQRSGNVAPPSTPYTPFSFASPSNHSAAAPTGPALGGQRRQPTMEVPDFTPLSRGRAPPPPRRSLLSRPAVLPQPVVQDAPFENLPPETEKRKKKIPPTLLAPRYSHLLEEAVAIGLEGSMGRQQQDQEQEEGVSGDKSAGDASFGQESIDESKDLSGNHEDEGASHQEHDESHLPPQPPNTLGKRVKGFLFSYLPTLAKTPSRKTTSQRPPQRGLPLPPPSVLEKPRGPVTTPARQPLPRVPHPKELVNLHPAPPPRPGASAIPRATKPKRLVDLVPVPREEEVGKDNEKGVLPRPRRSSASSVRDLVKGFEEMDKVAKEKAGAVKRMGSMGDLRKAWRAGAPDTRPKWKL